MEAGGVAGVSRNVSCIGRQLYMFFFFSSRRRHTRCREVSWARRCVQETDAEYMGFGSLNRSNFLIIGMCAPKYIAQHIFIKMQQLYSLLQKSLRKNSNTFQMDGHMSLNSRR
eukprot:TRINITY_DN20587_c0_g1_i1.p4 TRINITY_DN20587_c0_g1~~TRINITY_DN20587_c0_g1_i1.p4  ORF type:complete len:113 (-),score=22.86 TRINITY_DN20587_c0_g1_i1:446-784(-)